MTDTTTPHEPTAGDRYLITVPDDKTDSYDMNGKAFTFEKYTDGGSWAGKVDGENGYSMFSPHSHWLTLLPAGPPALPACSCEWQHVMRAGCKCGAIVPYKVPR